MSGNAWLIALTLFAGALMPLQAGINGQLARQLSGALGAALISFLIGSLALLALVLMQRSLPGADDPSPRFTLKIEDRHWYWLYLPAARLADFVAAKVAFLQQGRISIYLLYSFVTLIALLVFVA